MKHVVAKHQVHQSFSVDIKTKVVIIMTTKSLTETTRVVQHRSHTIKSGLEDKEHIRWPPVYQKPSLPLNTFKIHTPVSIKAILFNIPPQVGQQETENFIPETINQGSELGNRLNNFRSKQVFKKLLWIVEQTAVPKSVLSTGTIMEVAAVGSVKLVEAIINILWRMGVNHIQKHKETIGMANINQFF